MLEVLSRLVKKGDIGSLHIVNIAAQPEFARQQNIRSVPWLRIGPFVLQGLHNQQEIETWLARSRSEEGIQTYLTEMLSNGELSIVSRAVEQSPQIIKMFIPLISDEQTNINVRLGIGAIIEDLAGQAELATILPELIELLHHNRARVRSDAAHFLSFIKSPLAIAALKSCLDDTDSDVREIARESIETLEAD